MKTLVIYHKADFDGIFSREICRKYFRENAEYLGWDYGDPVPVVAEGREIVMVDISVDGLMDHRPLVWIDHHKSAIAKFSPDIPGYRIDGVAACRLAWQYFHTANVTRNPMLDPGMTLPDKQAFIDRKVVEPYAVQLAGEYDIWDKRNPHTDVFQSGLRAVEIAPAGWDELLDVDTPLPRSLIPAGSSRTLTEIILSDGRVLEHANSEANASLMRDVAFEMSWSGFRFLAINKPRGNSRTFAAGVKPEHDALLTFYWARSKWRVSLYHAPHRTYIDLSEIAVKHGGGGHRGACGFECKTLPFPLE